MRNTGRTLLTTVSVHPPAYRDEETELPAGKHTIYAESAQGFESSAPTSTTFTVKR